MNIKAKIEASDFNQDSVQILHVETLD